MKHLLYSLLALVSLASCSDHDPAPAPSLTGDSWTLQARSSVATPKDKAPEAPSAYPITEKVTITFHTETRFSMSITQNNGIGRQLDGSYTYQDQTLTFPAIISWPTSAVVSKTLRVTEHTAHKLVTQEQWQNIDSGYGYYEPTSYVTTQTFTR